MNNIDFVLPCMFMHLFSLIILLAFCPYNLLIGTHCNCLSFSFLFLYSFISLVYNTPMTGYFSACAFFSIKNAIEVRFKLVRSILLFLHLTDEILHANQSQVSFFFKKNKKQNEYDLDR